MITWAQLGIHDKPVSDPRGGYLLPLKERAHVHYDWRLQVGLLNVDGYYNSLLSFIDKAVDEGFITTTARHIIVSATSAHELMSKLEVTGSLGFAMRKAAPFSWFCAPTV